MPRAQVARLVLGSLVHGACEASREMVMQATKSSWDSTCMFMGVNIDGSLLWDLLCPLTKVHLVAMVVEGNIPRRICVIFETFVVSGCMTDASVWCRLLGSCSHISQGRE